MFYKLQLSSKYSELIRQNVLSYKAKLVFINALYHMDSRNILKGTADELKKMLGISRYEFVEGIRELKRYNCVRKYSKTEYMFNPELVYLGDEKRYFVMYHIWDTQTTQGLRE